MIQNRYNIIYLFKILIPIILLSISFSRLREEVIDRFENGQRKTVMKFIGEGNDEIMVEKLIYSDQADTLFLETNDGDLKVVKEYYNFNVSHNQEQANKIYAKKKYKDGKLYKWYLYYLNGGIKYDADSLDFAYGAIDSYQSGENLHGVFLPNYYDFRLDYHHNDVRCSGKIVSYYDNGNIQYEGRFKDGLQHGFWSSYYKSGNVEQKVEWGVGFRDEVVGILLGDFNWYYPNGEIYMDGQYGPEIENGNKWSSRTGEWIEYYEDGSFASKKNYRKGYRDGDFIDYYKNGQVKSEGAYTFREISIYLDEHKIGEWFTYYDNGQVESIENFDESGKRIGIFTAYYESGQVKSRGDYKNNQKFGSWFYYYESGQLEREESHSNRYGVSSTYYDQSGIKIAKENPTYFIKITYDLDNGMYTEKSYSKSGCGPSEYERDDPFCSYNETVYYADGQIKERKSKDSYYGELVLDGELVAYYPDGQLFRSENYYNGHRDKDWVEYYESGQILYKGTYSYFIEHYYKGRKVRKESVKVGDWVGYYENGQILYENKYDEHGIEVGEWIEYHENGQIKMTGKYIDGYKHGQWISYYDNGQFLKLESWESGKKHGNWFEYYKNKKTKLYQLFKSKEYWDDDKQHGKWMYYDENGKKKKKMVYENGVLVKEKEY